MAFYGEEDLKKTKEKKETLKGKGWAVLGIVLLVIGAISFLSCFIMPFILPLGDVSFVVFGVCSFVGMILLTVGILLGGPILRKGTLKYAKHITDYSKQEMTELNETIADTQLSSIEKVANSAKKGWEQGSRAEIKQKYCMKCGKGMPLDANFCGNCGEKQD